MQFEALFIGLKEGVKLSLCSYLVLSYFKDAGAGYLKRPFYVGIITVLFSSLVVITIHVTPEIRDFIVKLIGYVFGIFYLLSLGVLYHTTGTDLLGPLKGVFQKRLFLIPFVYVLTGIYFIPDMAGSSVYLGDLFLMSGDMMSVFIIAMAGFIGSLIGSHYIFKKIRWNVMRLFGLPQILLFLSLIKLFAGGVRGFTELSLIPSVQSGLMKLVHDAVHQTLVTLIVPDHQLLKLTTWNFIGFAFGKNVGLWLSLILFLVPLFIFLRKHFTLGIDVPHELPTHATRRKFIKSIKDERVLRSLPVVLFMMFILGTWFIEKGEGVARFNNPEPVPVVAEEGKVVIPISAPGVDLRDGMLHKFSIELDGDSVRIFVMTRGDGTLAVCLDACEICPPDGYVQGEKHVVCLYCMTPISIDTLGKPGGCNPIPLDALITEAHVEIEMSEIQKKWNKVNSGETKEEISR